MIQRFSKSLDIEDSKEFVLENNDDDIVIGHPFYDESPNVFPLFKDDSDLLNYKRLKLGQHVLLLVVPVLFLYLFVFITRSNLQKFADFGPYFTAAVSFGIIGLIICITYAVSMLLRHFCDEEHSETVYFIAATRVLNSQYKQYLDEFFLIIVTLFMGFTLYARVRVGTCPDTDVWNSQGCNPYANGTPTDAVLLCYISPILVQLLFKGIRITTIILSWAVSTIFIIISIVHVNAYTEIWTILYSLFFLFIMSEIERIMRVSYLQDKKVTFSEIKRKEASAALKIEQIATEKVKYELKIVSLQAEKDKRAIEVERARLRSLIGNVAHDLKTPLQSIGMSIELLRYDLRKHLSNETLPLIIRENNLLQLDSLNQTLDSLTSM